MNEKDFEKRWKVGETNPCFKINKECKFDKYKDGHCDVCYFCADHSRSEFGDCCDCPETRPFWWGEE